jgi:hypothetical protein
LLYERFNFLVWLRRIAPQCDYVREQLEIMRRLKPDFQERERPDVDFWSGDAKWFDSTEGFNVEEITTQDIPAFVAARPPFTDDDRFDSKRPRNSRSI